MRFHETTFFFFLRLRYCFFSLCSRTSRSDVIVVVDRQPRCSTTDWPVHTNTEKRTPRLGPRLTGEIGIPSRAAVPARSPVPIGRKPRRSLDRRTKRTKSGPPATIRVYIPKLFVYGVAEEFMSQLTPIFESLRQKEDLPCSYPLHMHAPSYHWVNKKLCKV